MPSSEDLLKVAGFVLSLGGFTLGLLGYVTKRGETRQAAFKDEIAELERRLKRKEEDIEDCQASLREANNRAKRFEDENWELKAEIRKLRGGSGGDD